MFGGLSPKPIPRCRASTGCLFDQCRFDAAADVRPIDTVYGVQSPGPGGTIVVRGSVIGARLSGWLAPNCVGCSVEP